MRLRLCIERNALPTTRALWPVKNGKSTIAQLLQQINDVFPLESDDWGLEDYSVGVGEYECLHYHEVGVVCKEDDELVIKPLQYVDVRARTLTGRAQIAPDGRHLVDGIPFGRPSLKAPTRPEIKIPPRKKRKLLGGGQAEGEPLLLTENGEGSDDEEDEEHDTNFEVDTSDDLSHSDDTSSSDEDEDSEDSSSESDSSSDDGPDSTSESDSEGSWDGIASSKPTTPSSKLSKSNTNHVNGVSDISSPRASATSKRKREADDANRKDEEQSPKVPEVSNDDLDKRRKQTQSRNERRRVAKKLKTLQERNILSPGASLSDARAWERGEFDDPLHPESIPSSMPNQTFHIQSDGATSKGDSIHPEAVPFIVRQLVMENGATEAPSRSSGMEGESNVTVKKKKRENAPDSAKDDENVEQPVKLEQERHALLKQIADGGIDVSQSDSRPSKKRSISANHVRNHVRFNEETPEEITSKEPSARPPNSTVVEADDNKKDETTVLANPPATARRSQLDLASSKRLLFAGLGVRMPKTQAERDQVQKKLAERPKRNTFKERMNIIAGQVNGTTNEDAPATATTTTGADVEDDPDAWEAKLDVSALECCDDGVTLSKPPFPFKQYWDPKYSKKTKAKRFANRHMDAKSKKQGRSAIREYDKYNIDGFGDALNYDDVVEGDEYWEDGALLGDDYGEEDGDGFPTRPASLDDLPMLREDDSKEGDFIAFAELACDEGTGWEPKTVTRLAKLIVAPNLTGDGKTWTIELSMRDRKPKVFDEEGERVYSKFEMPDIDEDDAADDGKKEVVLSELGDARLVLRPDPEAS